MRPLVQQCAGHHVLSCLVVFSGSPGDLYERETINKQQSDDEDSCGEEIDDNVLPSSTPRPSTGESLAEDIEAVSAVLKPRGVQLHGQAPEDLVRRRGQEHEGCEGESYDDFACLVEGENYDDFASKMADPMPTMPAA